MHHLTFLTCGKSYSFSVGWDSPEAEGLVEGEDQYLGVSQSCDLQQTGDCFIVDTCEIKRILANMYFFKFGVYLGWEQLSLCSSVRAFPWQYTVPSGLSGQQCSRRYLMNDRQLSRVDCANGDKWWWFCGTYLTCTEKFLHHIRLPKQGCFMEGAAFLCLRIKTGSIKTEILYTAESSMCWRLSFQLITLENDTTKKKQATLKVKHFGFTHTTWSTLLLIIMWLRNQSIFQLTGAC